VGDDPERPGVRDGHRDGVHAHREPDAELLDDHPDGLGEGVPAHVGLGAGQHQEGRVRRVVGEVDGELRVRVVRPVVLVEGHAGPAGAVVEQRVDVEDGHRLRAVHRQQLLAGQSLGAAGVDVAVQRLQQDGPVERGDVARQLVQVARVLLAHALLLRSGPSGRDRPWSGHNVRTGCAIPRALQHTQHQQRHRDDT
jgi:hypothetical protein